MGCDIHVKTYVWSKDENKYIDAFQVCEAYDVINQQFFPNLMEGIRYYDLFGCFGEHHRSYYRELPRFTYGIPDFLKDTTFAKMQDDLEPGCYGYKWYHGNELKEDILKYIERLKDPLEYFEEDSDDYLDYKDGTLKKEDWLKDNEPLINSLQEIYNQISMFDNIKKQAEDSYSLEKVYCDHLDFDKTIFLFWFDN